MKRFAMSDLYRWKQNPQRKPLIISGARQVGKTWLMREFGREAFEQTVYINFDENPRMGSLFAGDISPSHILPALEIESGLRIDPENTLLIFDEIQEVPRALTSLKYFNEESPEIAVMAAGSLLGVAMHQGTSYPVGKVTLLNLYPLNFREFLYALGEDRLSDVIASGDTSMMHVFHEKLISLLKDYYFTGGMPEVVNRFAAQGSYTEIRPLQQDLLAFYRQDFSKHAPPSLLPRLFQVWDSVHTQLAKENRKLMYGQIRSGARAKDFELAIEWLSDCGLVHKIHRVKKPLLPLSSYTELNVFKLFLCDTGLLGAMAGIPAQALLEGSRLFTDVKGAMTEQYVLQQLISDLKIHPFYYSTENSRGEIDFLIQSSDDIIPVEVKAEENLRSRSLRAFCNKFEPDSAIRFSMSEYRSQEWMTNIPLYAVGMLKEPASIRSYGADGIRKDAKRHIKTLNNPSRRT